MVSFIVGIFAVFFLFLNQTPVKIQKISSFENQSTFFNPPKPLKCREQENNLASLIQKRAELKVWLERNKDAPKKQKAAKHKELDNLNLQIGIIENLENFKGQILKDEEVAMDLLYRCK